MKIKHFIVESPLIRKNGENQLLKDPYDGDHIGQVVGWETLTPGKFEEFIRTHNLKFHRQEDIPSKDDGGRGEYKLSINAIPLNSPSSEDYVHILIVKIIGKGAKSIDPRDYVYYISYSPSEDFEDSYSGRPGYSVRRVDQLPIYSSETGIGSNSSRNLWRYSSDNANATKWQDAIKPSDFNKLIEPEYGNLDNTHHSRRIGLGFEKNKDYISAHKSKTDADIASQTSTILSNLNSKPITVSNITRVVKNSKLPSGDYRGNRTREYLADLMSIFTKPNNKGNIYPLQYTDVADGNELFNTIGIEAVQSIMTDFMEVVHPVALLAGNCNGNASRIAESFFGATQEELINNAVIRFSSSSNERLIDSTIYYSGGERGYKRLGVSSKQQGGFAIKPNSPSFTSLYTAWQEVQQIASDMWTKEVVPQLNKNAKFKLSWDLISRRMVSKGQEITPKMVNDMAITWGIPSTDPEEVLKTVGNSPEFKQLIIWILNHSATIQVDTHANYGDEDTPPVLSNIIATWPTQLATHVKVDIAENNFSLVVNGSPIDFTPVLGDRDDIEYGDPGNTFSKVTPQGYANANGDVELKTLARGPSTLQSSPYPAGREAGTNKVSYGLVAEKRLFAWASEDKTSSELVSEFNMDREAISAVLAARAAMIGFIENTQYSNKQKMSILKYLPSGNENKNLTKAIEVLSGSNATAKNAELGRIARYIPDDERQTVWKNVRGIGLTEEEDHYNFLQKAYVRLVNLKNTNRAKYGALSQDAYGGARSTTGDLFSQPEQSDTPASNVDPREIERLFALEVNKILASEYQKLTPKLQAVVGDRSWPRQLDRISVRNINDIIQSLNVVSRGTYVPTKQAAVALIGELRGVIHKVEAAKPEIREKVKSALEQEARAKQPLQRAPLSPEKQRIRGLIKTARSDNRAKDYRQAYRTAKDFYSEPDSEIDSLLETSSILRGIMGR